MKLCRPHIHSLFPSRFFARQKKRLASDHGLVNIASLALTVPLVIVVAIAAFDIMRLPIYKQQLYNMLDTGYDHLLAHYGADGLPVHRAPGRNWCAVVNDNNTDADCDHQACEYSDPPTCTGSGDIAFGTSVAAIDQAVKSIEEGYAESEGLFNLASAGPNRFAAKGAIYRLVVRGLTGSDSKESVEVVKAIRIAQYSRAGGVGFAGFPNTDEADDLLISTMFSSKLVGSRYGLWSSSTPHGTHVTVVLLWAAYRANNYFAFPNWLELGLPPRTALGVPMPYDRDQTIVSASIVRVLPSQIRLTAD